MWVFCLVLFIFSEEQRPSKDNMKMGFSVTGLIFSILSMHHLVLLNQHCGEHLLQLSPLNNLAPADHKLHAGSGCAVSGAIRTEALQIKHAVTSSKAVETVT